MTMYKMTQLFDPYWFFGAICFPTDLEAIVRFPQDMHIFRQITHDVPPINGE